MKKTEYHFHRKIMETDDGRLFEFWPVYGRLWLCHGCGAGWPRKRAAMKTSTYVKSSKPACHYCVMRKGSGAGAVSLHNYSAPDSLQPVHLLPHSPLIVRHTPGFSGAGCGPSVRASPVPGVRHTPGFSGAGCAPHSGLLRCRVWAVCPGFPCAGGGPSVRASPVPGVGLLSGLLRCRGWAVCPGFSGAGCGPSVWASPVPGVGRLSGLLRCRVWAVCRALPAR